jgi:hypothetical protein
VKVTRFDPNSSGIPLGIHYKADLIFVRGHVWGPHGSKTPLRLVVDTVAAETIIAPELLDELGYSPRQDEAISSIRSVVGVERGWLLRVARFRALGHDMINFRVDAPDPSEEIDGLLGLSFLRHLKLEIHPTQGRILADRLG